jgi:hypothetical protein
MKRALAPIALTSALLSSGCFPVAMLPSEHRLGGGVVGGSMRGSDAEPSAARVGAQFHYRGSIHVLALVPELYNRDFDFGLGYVLMAHESGSFQHGPSVDFSYFPVREVFDEVDYGQFRLALRAEADVRFTGAEPGAVGFGGRGGVRFDFSWFPDHAIPVQSTSVSSNGNVNTFIGEQWGEYGVAFDVLAGGGFVGTQAYGEGLIAITLRAPAIVGVFIGIP